MSKESGKTVENLLKEINEKLDLLNEAIGVKIKSVAKKKKTSSYSEAYKKAMAPYERGNEQIRAYIKDNTK